MTLLVRMPRDHAAERRYAVQVVLGEFLGIAHDVEEHDEPEVHLLLAGAPFERFVRVADGLFRTPAAQWLTESSLPPAPLPVCDVPAEWDPHGRLVDHRLPVLYGTPEPPRRYLAETRRDITIGIDVFGSAFFMLTRYEELVARRAGAPHDEHDRFPARASLARQAGFLHRPLVDEYVAVLSSALARLHPRLVAAPATGRLLLSHDVDRPRMHDAGVTWSSVLRRAGRELVGGAAGRGGARIASYARRRRGRDPYDTFDFLLGQSERVGAVSTFNVMTGCSDPRFDPGYDPRDGYLRDRLRRIAERGHRIGFHPSYRTSDDLDLARREFLALRELLAEQGIATDSIGGRQHFLRWHNPTTWRNWSALGAEHDGTLAFPEEIGFRCGTGRSYPVFDLEERRALPLREQPLLAMDTTLLEYMGLSPAEAIRRTGTLAATCRRLGGDVSLLVHNSTLFSTPRRRWYADLLDEAA